MMKTLRTLCVLTIFLTAGCASTWSMNTDVQGTELQWPQSPGKAKVRYLMAVKGFKETGMSLNGMLFGKEEGLLLRPSAVSAGRDGRLAIADSACQCVHLYLPSGQRYYRLSAAGDEGMISPVAVVFDGESRLYVSDSGLGKVLVFDSHGEYLSMIEKAGGVSLQRPTGLAFDDERKVLYVVDTLSHKIYSFDPKGTFLFSFGERGDGNGQFNYPTHISWSAPGRIYVTDSMNFRIQIFDTTGNFLAAFGHQGDGSGDFAMPKGVASDKDHTIYVVDSLFDNVQLFNDRGDFLLTVGGRGIDPGEFWLPSGIFIDANDRLYVCDTFNQRVQVFLILRNPLQGEKS